MSWKFNVSCTTMCVSSNWMIQSTGWCLFVWLIDCNPKKMEASIWCPRRCCWCELHPLLDLRWSLRRQIVWDNHLIIWNYSGIYLFSRSSSWCYPKPRTEFRYWNIQWSLDLLGVGTGSIRPELESMRNEMKKMILSFSLILWYNWWFNNDTKRKGFRPLSLWGELAEREYDDASGI